MKDIVIDVTRLIGHRLVGRRATGIDRVSLEYIRHYGELASAAIARGRLNVVLSPRQAGPLFEVLLDPAASAGELARSLAVSPFADAPVAGATLFHTAHSGLEFSSTLARLRQRGALPVVFVHDLIPIEYPEYCRPGEFDRHAARMRNALATATGIIVNSACTLAALEAFAARTGMACPPTVVAHLGSAPLSASGPRPIQRPYFVVLGTIEPRKNHSLLLQIWRTLATELGDAAPCLVLIGQRGWECENVVDLLERSTPLAGTVVQRPDCGDAELAVYLQHAQALLMPSFAEGYGLPVVEALAAGLPVIAAKLPVYRELAGDTPEYLDPLDGPGWSRVIRQYADADSPARRGQLERIRQLRHPTWGDHFSAVDTFLEQLNRQG